MSSGTSKKRARDGEGLRSRKQEFGMGYYQQWRAKRSTLVSKSKCYYVEHVQWSNVVDSMLEGKGLGHPTGRVKITPGRKEISLFFFVWASPLGAPRWWVCSHPRHVEPICTTTCWPSSTQGAMGFPSHGGGFYWQLVEALGKPQSRQRL